MASGVYQTLQMTIATDVNAELDHDLSLSLYIYICNIYNMSGRVVSDIQTRAEGEWLYI